MVSLAQVCLIAVLLVAATTADPAVRRKRQLISIDLEENVAVILRDLKSKNGGEEYNSYTEKGGKKGGKKGRGGKKGTDGGPKGDDDDDDKSGKGGKKGLYLTYAMSMDMSMSFSPSAAPQFAPTAPPEPLLPPSSGDCLQGSTREDVLLETLSSITDSDLLEDTLTPQGMAFDWMLTTDTDTDVCTYNTLEQRFAMATFYFSTGGDDWTSSKDWLSSDSECDWEFAGCNDDSELSELEIRK
jgi:hypothetical protein